MGRSHAGEHTRERAKGSGIASSVSSAFALCSVRDPRPDRNAASIRSGDQNKPNTINGRQNSGGGPMRHWPGAEFPCGHLEFPAHVARIAGEDMMQIVRQNCLSAPLEVGQPDG